MHNYPYPRIAGPRRRHPARQIKQFSAVVSALAAPSVTATAHRGRRGDFFRQPGNTPDQEHNLRPGQLITAIEVPV
jgi:xanthine dehydrogenase YagS FAD-binding subunit